MTLHLTERKLEALISESVRKALKEELTQLRVLAVPNVSKAEQNEIEKLYGRPSKKSARKIRTEL